MSDNDKLMRRRRSRGLRAEADALLRAPVSPTMHSSSPPPFTAPPLPPPLPLVSASPPPSPDPSPLSRSPAPRDTARLSQVRDVARSFVKAPPPDGRVALEQLHKDAMQLMDSAAGAAVTSPTPQEQPGASRTHGRYTAMRIRRDKQRLEQQYLAAMSFLDRADAGDSDVLIEERELDEPESAAQDKRQLQNYAREAMSFLDKAFNQDESVLIDDEESDDGSSRHITRIESQQVATADADSIAHDRAELARYAEEYGDFLDKALDGSEANDDTESQTSASDRGLFGRRVMQSFQSSQTIEDDLSEADTDDEFQDPALIDAVHRRSPAPSPVASNSRSYDDWRSHSPPAAAPANDVDDETSVRRRIQMFEQEANVYLQETNVSDGEEYHPDDDRRRSPAIDPLSPMVESAPNAHNSTRMRMQQYEKDAGAFLDDANVSEEETEDEEVVSGDPEYELRGSYTRSSTPGYVPDAHDDVFDVDREIQEEDERYASAPGTPVANAERGIAAQLLHQQSRKAGRPPTMPRMSPPGQRAPPPDCRDPSSLSRKDMRVNIVLTGTAGSSEELEQVPLERSFFRKLPRGTTVQILPRASMLDAENDSSVDGGVRADIPASIEEELRKMASERDAVIGALEEIVNERSMLAAQVGEMKNMIAQAVGKGESPSSKIVDGQDIDLSGELYSAYEFMRTMTEETEETINFLEAEQYKMSVEKSQLERELDVRDDEAEELKSQVARLLRVNADKECSACKSLANVTSDLEVARMEAREAELRNEELQNQLVVAKRELLTKQQSILAQQELLANDKLRLEERCTELQSGWDSDRQVLRDLNMKLEDSDRRSKQLEDALEASESSLLRERVEASKGDESTASTIEKLKSDVENAEAEAVVAKRASITAEDSARSAHETLEEVQTKAQRSETEVERLRRDLDKISVENDVAQAELRSMRAKYEDSVKVRAATAAKSLESAELQRTIDDLKRAARAREEQMRKQMGELKEHADRAVSAAQTAERNAADAAQTAATAHTNAQSQVDAERATRLAAERRLQEKIQELDTIRSESKAWERYAREKAEQLVDDAASAATSARPSRRAISNLVASGSKRGVARKNNPGDRHDRAGGRVRYGAAPSANASVDEGGRKKPYRRLFG